MGILSSIFGTREEKILKTCTQIYNKAKAMRPGKTERDYLKIVLITKPPFDYQGDQILNDILDSCNSIEELSKIIAEEGKVGSSLWILREKNIRLGAFENRNRQYFSEFWG